MCISNALYLWEHPISKGRDESVSCRRSSYEVWRCTQVTTMPVRAWIFIDKSLNMNILLIYFLCINFFTFIIRWRDKRKAVKQQWRVSERQLLVLCILGWWGGALAGMQMFRHKTIKGAFLWKFWLVVIIRVIVFFYLLFNWVLS